MMHSGKLNFLNASTGVSLGRVTELRSCLHFMSGFHQRAGEVIL
jgi:hypothetical protein